MGDPGKTKKKFETPSHPWQKERIDEEKALVTEYGLKNKKELWKMRTILIKLADQAKKLTAETGEQAEKERLQLLARVRRIGLAGGQGDLSSLLDLELKDILERRLQTLVFKKGLARSIKQARQFITHGHIMVADKKITVPSYIVSSDEEPEISFIALSSLSDEDHPERSVKEQMPKRKAKPKKEEKAGEKSEEKEEKKSGSEKKEKTPAKGKKKEEQKEAKKPEEKKEEPKKEPKKDDEKSAEDDSSKEKKKEPESDKKKTKEAEE